MHRSTSILVVLLGASLLANAMLALRLSRAPEPEPSTACKAPAADRAAKEEAGAALQAILDQERRKNEELRAKIDRLETDKKVLAQVTAPTDGKAEKLAAFRQKLRKLMKMMKDPAAKAGAVDPDSMVELTDTMMEFFKMSALRAKEPKTYADYLQAFYEIGLEGDATALTADQSSTLSKLFQDFGEELARIPPTPSGERLLREIESEAATMAKVRTLLTDAQRTALSKDNMDALAAGNMMSMSYVNKQGAADQIAQQWSALYQLDPAQLPQAKAAAQSYVDAMARLDAQDKSGALRSFGKTGTPESYDHRIKSVREQIAALNLLQATLTPAQQEKLRTQALREILLLDTNVQVTPAEK